MKMLKKYIAPIITLLVFAGASFAAAAIEYCIDGTVCQGKATKSLNEKGICPACQSKIDAETQYAWEEKEAKEKSV
jgi:hypothetical protein